MDVLSELNAGRGQLPDLLGMSLRTSNRRTAIPQGTQWIVQPGDKKIWLLRRLGRLVDSVVWLANNVSAHVLSVDHPVSPLDILAKKFLEKVEL